ncbi:hypothetical protein B0H10DRAFT_2240170 [Mycena sp. CBHHK59/15]|nr:hypothetical protein B0H10DRAFT_2240170 [Mycena sp. CBHHK59/15]
MEQVIYCEKLGVGAKRHYCIFHDECCFHANDQSSFVWMREGEQELQGKSRGRLVHVSDFIIEDTSSGQLSLTADQILSQLELPKAPTQTQQSVATEPPTPQQHPEPRASEESMAAPKKTKSKKAPKPRNKRRAPATGRTEADHSWVPPPAPEGTNYQLPSFDARRIIYPGANHDAWWDMPQLIAQAGHFYGADAPYNSWMD